MISNCGQFRLALVLIPAFALAPACRQVLGQVDADIPTIKTQSNLVVVDVVARNHRGELVTGLQASDFHLLEDGVAQRFSFFEEHKGARISNAKLPAMPANVFTNFSTVKAPDGVDIVLVDCLNTEPKNQVSLRENLIKYLKHANPNGRVAVFTLGSKLRLVHGFTSDFAGLALAIGDAKSGATTEFSRLFATAFQRDTDKSILAMMAINQASPEAIDALSQFQTEETSRLTASREVLTSQAIQQLLRYTSRIPGRKNLVWFADSFPISVGPSDGEHRLKHHHAEQDLASLLSHSQVAVYPVSTQGLTVDAQYDTGIFNPDSMQQQSAERASTQIEIQDLAKETGGEAFMNSNDFSGSLNRALRDGTDYYTIAYRPLDARGAGRFRRINIEVRNCNCKLAYRQGYYAEDPSSPKTGEGIGSGDPLISLMQFGMPNFDQIVYSISIASPKVDRNTKEVSQPPSRPGTGYDVNFAVSTADVRLKQGADGIRHGELGIMLVAYSREGKPLAVVSRRFKLAIPPRDFEALENVGLQLQGQIDIPAGQSYLVTGVYDYQAGTAGTLTVPVSISSQK